MQMLIFIYKNMVLEFTPKTILVCLYEMSFWLYEMLCFRCIRLFSVCRAFAEYYEITVRTDVFLRYSQVFQSFVVSVKTERIASRKIYGVAESEVGQGF